MMEEANSLMRNFVKLLQCSRRKDQQTRPSATPHQGKKVSTSKAHYESDSVSTEPGDVSNNEFSDASNLTDVQTDGSYYAHTRRSNAPMRSPPGLVGPPGLQAPWQAPAASNPGPPWRAEKSLNANASSFVPASATTGLNAGATRFVPNSSQGFIPEGSDNVRQSIRMLKGVLEDWEANLPAAQPQPATQQDPNANSLFAALAKLTPEEAATVRSMLDYKLASPDMAMTNNAMQPGMQPAMQPPAQPKWIPPENPPPGRVHRPFTPFQGARAPPWEKSTGPGQRARTGIAGPQKRAPANDDDEETLATQLKDLAQIDNARVLMVRRINRLGVDSPGPLKEYFSKFGEVERVMAAPTRSKGQFGLKSRVRPAPLGFVVMKKPSEVNAVLANGAEHVVCGHTICALPFVSHDVDTKE